VKSIFKVSLALLAITLALTAIALAFLSWFEGQHPSVARVQYYAVYFDVLKAIWVGIAIALLPVGIGELRQDFERLKESRIAYSEAKTGVDYLSLRVSSLTLKEAAALIQQVHVRKHQAELYEELEFHLRRRGYEGTPVQWGDMLYEELFRVRGLLEANAGQWDKLEPDERLKIVQKEQPP
jgi:hypothetical protein